MKAPCYNCQRRTQSCHQSCVDYKKFIKENDEKKSLIRHNRETENMVTETLIRNARKARKEALHD